MRNLSEVYVELTNHIVPFSLPRGYFWVTSQRGVATSEKNTALFESVADSLIFTNHQWRPFSAGSPKCLRSGVRKHNRCMWFTQLNTEKEKTFFSLRCLFCFRNAEGMGQLLRKRFLRVPAIGAGARELSGWWHTQTADSSVWKEGLVKPEALLFSVSSHRVLTEGYDPLLLDCHSRRRVANTPRTNPSFTGGLKNDRVIDYALWWHVSYLPDSRQITEGATALWYLL